MRSNAPAGRARAHFLVILALFFLAAGRSSAGARLSARDIVVAIPGLRAVTYVPVSPDFDYGSCNATPRPVDLRCGLLAEGGFDAEGRQYSVRLAVSEGGTVPPRSEIWRTTAERSTELVASLDARPDEMGAFDEATIGKLAVDPVRGVIYAVLASSCLPADDESCSTAAKRIEIVQILGLRLLAQVLADPIPSDEAVDDEELAQGGRPFTGSSPGRTDVGSAALATPLAIDFGGTGASSAEEARAMLGSASDDSVVHLFGDERILGDKTFLGSMTAPRFNGVRHAALFGSIAATISDLPATGGVLALGPDVDDPTSFANINPAGMWSGRPDTLALDFRHGGARFLSSMREYPSGSAGALEDRVPFVFQVRLDDASAHRDTAAGAIGEWNCGRARSGRESCPSGESTWGQAGGSRQYWYSGQCNTSADSLVGDAAICGGPHIFEIRYPEQPGVHASKPIFAVGNGGAALFAPDNRSPGWRSFLTMFRGDDGLGDPTKANTPMYAFDSGGASFDGGLFVGASQSFPEYTRHLYDQFNVWISHDIAYDKAALVVEGPSAEDPGAQTAALVRFLDRSGKGTFAHPGIAREAFGFYNHSRLYLGSFRDDETADRGQFIEWEGTRVDANTTRLRVSEPSAPRDLVLPDRSGTIVVASSASGLGLLMWGSEGKSGTEVCGAAGLACERTRNLGESGSRPCSVSQDDDFAALCSAPQ